MIRKAISVLLVTALFTPFQSSASIFKSFSDEQLELIADEIEASILPSTTNALNTSDSSEVSFLEIAATDEYSKFDFKKWNAVNYNLFLMAFKGYLVMKNDAMISKSQYLTIINFEMSSNLKRMWVLDMKNHKIVFHDLVSHGRNSGEEFATSFSNAHESYKSSLGFYVTGIPYMGKNDYSLRLHGVEEGFNDNAFDRGIVMHAAEYVCNSYICSNKRLGRSQGCPAVSPKINKQVINTIQGGSCLFIYYPDKKYLKVSGIINAKNPSKEYLQSSEYALNLP